MRSKRLTFVLFAICGILNSYGKPPKGSLTERIGICTSLQNASIVKAAGGHHVEQSISDFMMPEKSEEEFAKNKEAAAASVLPILSCNGFFPGDLRLTGPNADHERAVRYTEVAMKRCAETGVVTAVLGSGGARSIPEGFSREEGEAQFVALLKRLGPIAKKYGVTIVIEPLRKQECNFINTVAEGCAIARKVNHPNVRVLADLYHMMQEGEGPQSILDAGRKYLRHVHIAEKVNRTPPGVDGDDFTPYFRALKKIKYQGNISIECGWSDFRSQARPAIEEVKRQLKTVYEE
ncbi:MAG: sugar phosphate isomerase/epimerase [Bacteroidaceae bacterium]|nr:sugar phosphate isomerase/epimerase [Bacteroidaceae bacterium]